MACDGHTVRLRAVGSAEGWLETGGRPRVLCRRRGGQASGGVPVSAPPCPRGEEHVCADSPPDCRRENHISSRLQIKQYLWAIVIKGKFNSMLMPHYARLCQGKPGPCSWLHGPGAAGAGAAARSVPVLPAPVPGGGLWGGGCELFLICLVPGMSSALRPQRAHRVVACVLGQLWVLTCG